MGWEHEALDLREAHQARTLERLALPVEDSTRNVDAPIKDGVQRVVPRCANQCDNVQRVEPDVGEPRS